MDSILGQLYGEIKERKSQFVLSFIIAFVLMHWRILLESLDFSINMKQRISVLEQFAQLHLMQTLWRPVLYAFFIVFMFWVFNTAARVIAYAFNEILWSKFKIWVSKIQIVEKYIHDELKGEAIKQRTEIISLSDANEKLKKELKECKNQINKITDEHSNCKSLLKKLDDRYNDIIQLTSNSILRLKEVANNENVKHINQKFRQLFFRNIQKIQNEGSFDNNDKVTEALLHFENLLNHEGKFK